MCELVSAQVVILGVPNLESYVYDAATKVDCVTEPLACVLVCEKESC